MFHIDLNSNIPLYEQLANRIIELSLLGLLKQDDALPSIRNLAKEVGINPNTVSKAYNELEKEHMIYSISGKGSFISTNQEILELYLTNKQKELIKCAHDLHKFGMPSIEIITLIQKELKI